MEHLELDLSKNNLGLCFKFGQDLKPCRASFI